MFRKFRNLDRIEKLEKRVEAEKRTTSWWEKQASRQCLEIKHLKSELKISDKRMEEYQAAIDNLVQQHENRDAVNEKKALLEKQVQNLREKIAKQDMQLSVKKEALIEAEAERVILRKANKISKEEVTKLEEQLAVTQSDLSEWEDIAKTRANEINDLIERVAYYEEVEDGNVHEYQKTIAKLKEQNKRLKKGMKK